jgi:hypothetical protein
VPAGHSVENVCNSWPLSTSRRKNLQKEVTRFGRVHRHDPGALTALGDADHDGRADQLPGRIFRVLYTGR